MPKCFVKNVTREIWYKSENLNSHLSIYLCVSFFELSIYGFIIIVNSSFIFTYKTHIEMRFKKEIWDINI